MGMTFEQQYLNKRAAHDDLYDAYLEKWLEYHRRCERFDRSLTHDGRPTPATWSRMNQHAREVRKEVFIGVPQPANEIQRKKFNDAKLEAVRIVERDFS